MDRWLPEEEVRACATQLRVALVELSARAQALEVARASFELWFRDVDQPSLFASRKFDFGFNSGPL